MKNNVARKFLFKLKASVLQTHTASEANTYLQKMLASDKPIMVARFGAVEIKAVLYGILPPQFLKY